MIEADLSILRQRLLAPLLSPPPQAREIEPLLETLTAEGSWPDLDYADQDRTYWKAIAHLRRLLLLARAYRAPESPLREEARLPPGVFAALDFWLRRDLVNPNWWYNQIGVPHLLSQSLLLLEAELDPKQREKGLEILSRADMEQANLTGQNLVWIADLTIRRGLFENHPERVAAAFRRIAAEIQIAAGEGIQADFSFHQHGPCLYSHGYGAGFAEDCSRLAVLAAGTSFALPTEKLDLLVRLVLEGHQWFTRGVWQDFGTFGREIARPGHTAAFLRQVVGYLGALPTGREAELKALAARLDDEEVSPLVGNRHFWRSDIMVHHRPGFYASARMHSDRLANTDDPCNDEGLKSHHLADGATCILRSGREYFDLFPVWDWRKIPGTTVVQTPALRGPVRRQGSRPFAGGVSDGECGLAAFDFERDGLVARKSWFFFDEGFLCLGAGISSPAGYPVITTVNQCHLRGRAITSRGPLSAGLHSFSDLEWIYHDGIAYFFFFPAAVRVQCEVRSGSWWELSRSMPQTRIEHPVFALWIDHGLRPREAAYAYLVAPGMSLSTLVRPSVEILANTPQIQAVRCRETTGIALYCPGSLEIEPGWRLAADCPCLLLLRQRDAEIQVSVASPENRELTIALESSKRLMGEGVEEVGEGSQVRFSLPGGLEAGRTLSRTLHLAS